MFARGIVRCAAGLICLFAGIFAGTRAEAQTQLPDYGGCIGCRSNITGDWLGLRTPLAASGILFDGDVTQYYQGVAAGGRRQRFEYGAHNDYRITMDMGQVAGMTGMFVKLHGESQLGEFINNDTGAFLASNTSGMLPSFTDRETALTGINVTQMLSPTFGVFAGKIDTLDGDLNRYAHGRGKDQFMNIGLVATPIAFRTMPYSTWGAGFFMLGAEGTPWLSFSVLDPRNYATKFDLDEVFSEGVTLGAEVRLPVNILGEPGHHLFGALWGSRDVALLSSAPLLILPIPGITPPRSDSWAMYWNFDQQLIAHPCDPTRGWGVFGRAAIADENTNPIESFISFGIGGDSPWRGDSGDTFGVGWFQTTTSDDLPALLLSDHGQGVELFYNFQVNQWLNLTPDVQVIDPALRQADTALVIGLRAKVTL